MIKYVGISDEIVRIVEGITGWKHLGAEQVMQILGRGALGFTLDDGSFSRHTFSAGEYGYNSGYEDENPNAGWWIALDTDAIETYKELCEILLNAEEREPGFDWSEVWEALAEAEDDE